MGLPAEMQTAEERAGDKHQLVVALTANAMREDQGRCRAAGMDG